jgi:hypothetical protein
MYIFHFVATNSCLLRTQGYKCLILTYLGSLEKS